MRSIQFGAPSPSVSGLSASSLRHQLDVLRQRVVQVRNAYHHLNQIKPSQPERQAPPLPFQREREMSSICNPQE